MKYETIEKLTNNLDNLRVPLNSRERSKKESKKIYPYIGANNIMGYIDEYIFDQKILCIAEDGGSWGKFETCAKIYNEKVWVNNHAHVLTAKENLNLEYLCYYLNFEDLNLYIKGATRGKLTKSTLNKIKIPLPPLATQKKIAAILDAADAYRQKTKALIAKYEELTQSLFLEMFGDPVRNEKGWATKKLVSLCSVGSGKRVFTDELVEDGIPFYRGTEIGQLGEGKEIHPKLFISNEHYESLKKHTDIPNLGDLLLPSICPDGRIWIVDQETPFYFKDGRVLWIKVDPSKINSYYLRYHLKGSFFANYHNIASGTTFAELKIVALKKMGILFPQIEFQNQFAERVQAIEQQKAQAEASLVKAEELFQGLLQKSFRGEIG